MTARKFTDAQREAIRAEYTTGVSQKALATKYGVSRAAIGNNLKPEHAAAVTRANRQRTLERTREREAKYRAANQEKTKAAVKKWQTTNYEHFRETARMYKETNADTLREKSRLARLKGYRENPVKYLAACARWATKNPEKLSELRRRRRARVAGAQGMGVSPEVWADIIILGWGNACCYCGQPFTANNKPTLDHIQPLARGGSHWPDNLAPACGKCNSSKGAKLLADWRPHLAELVVQLASEIADVVCGEELNAPGLR